MTTIEAKVFIDFDNDGSFATVGDEIDQDDIGTITCLIGFTSSRDDVRVADIGGAQITLKNFDRTYSPENTGSTYFGKMVPNLPVKIEVHYGASSWTLFEGTILAWTPEPDQYGTTKTTRIDCQDNLGKLQETKLTLPLIEEQTADYAMKQVGSFVYRTDAADAEFAFSGIPANNDTVTIGDITYTFKTSTPAAAYEVYAQTSATVSAQNLCDAINVADTASTTYGPNTFKHPDVTAEGPDGSATCTVLANARGAWGNSVSISESSASISITGGGATLTGGVDGPAGKFSYETGILEFVLMGHTWRPGETNGLTAWTDCVESEFGLGWCDRDGTLQFKNKDWFFTRYVQTPDLTSNDGHNVQDGRTSIQDIFTRATVNYNPTKLVNDVVVAQSNAPIQVPGQVIANDRYSPWSDQEATNDGSKVVTIPFKNTESSDTIGADDLKLPLTPATDYEVYTDRAGSGSDLSGNGWVTFAIAQTGSNVEVGLGNTSNNELWVHNLQVRGTRIEEYYPVRIVLDDTDSQNTYGRRELSYNLPFAANDVENFATSLAQHLLFRNADARFVITRIGFTGIVEVGGVNVYSLEIGDIIQLSETQTAISNQLYVILGIETALNPDGNPSVTFIVRRVDDVEYWILEDADSELGVNTILGV